MTPYPRRGGYRLSVKKTKPNLRNAPQKLKRGEGNVTSSVTTNSLVSPSEKPGERQRARLIAGEPGRNVAKLI